jgi:hypothetical protein
VESNDRHRSNICHDESERMTFVAHRHRTDKLTTKHTIIGDYKKILLDIANFEEVDSIITGQIFNNKTHHTGLTFQYMTDTGIKLLAKTSQAVQEIFIVTKHKQTVLDLLQGYGLLDSDLVAKAEEKTEPPKSTGRKKQTRRQEARVTERTQPSVPYVQPERSLSFGDHLQSDVLAKLLAAKAQLEQEHSGSSKPSDSSRTKSKTTKRPPTVSAEDEDLTMEELLNPKDDTDSFEELLNRSNLDWRKFK